MMRHQRQWRVQIDRAEWMTESGFSLFKTEFAATRATIWQRMYELNRNTIQIKKSRMALPNLEIIVKSTLKISNKTGFSVMSLRELSRECGLSMGALYSYIESKDTLLAMILEQVQDLVQTVLDDDSGKRAPPRERLRRLVRRHIFLTELMQPWFFFAYMEARGFDAWGKRMAIGSELRTQGLIADCISAGQTAGLYRPHDAVMTASLVKPLLQDWYLKRWKYRGANVSPDCYASWVIRFLEAFIDQQAPAIESPGTRNGAPGDPVRYRSGRDTT